MKDLELRLTDLLARKADDVDVSPVDGFAESLSTNGLASTVPDSPSESQKPATIVLETTITGVASRRRSTRAAHGILAVACAAAVVGTLAVVGRDDGATTPTDTALMAASPLEEPSRQEVALASNAGIYRPGTGPTAVTSARSYASLRTCASEPDPAVCEGSAGWAYVTGSADAAEVHYGLLGTADDLVLSALDDRYFVASAPTSLSQDPPSAPPAWLIDSVTGHRGALTWRDQPTTLSSAEQALALAPAPHAVPAYTDPGARFLPLVVDRADRTIRSLRVPAGASAALAIHQHGSGRIWIGTSPDGGDVGLAYTDDGGATWTDVELPQSLRPTSEELLSVTPGRDDLLVVAATGDHVAVTEAWASNDPAGELFVTDDAGENWNTLPLDDADGNGRGLAVLSDDRLMVTASLDLPSTSLLVSSSSSDWTQLEEPDYSDNVAQVRSRVEVYQDGTVLHYELSASDWHMDFPVKFSADLSAWWTVPGLVLTCGEC